MKTSSEASNYRASGLSIIIIIINPQRNKHLREERPERSSSTSLKGLYINFLSSNSYDLAFATTRSHVRAS